MGSASQDDDGLISAINVTPLVDITLVLLIVFMVTAKLIVSQSLGMDLPQAASGEAVQLVFGVELRADGELLVDGESVSDDREIVGLAREALRGDAQLRAVIRADEKVSHGRVIRTLDLLKQAGVSRIAFGVTTAPAAEEVTAEANVTTVEPEVQGAG